MRTVPVLWCVPESQNSFLPGPLQADGAASSVMGAELGTSAVGAELGTASTLKLRYSIDMCERCGRILLGYLPIMDFWEKKGFLQSASVVHPPR